jgi:hypothetical protein
MHANEHKEKKRKKEERNKGSPYFQIRDTHPKREIHDSKEYQKYFELGLWENSTLLVVLNSHF